MDPQTTWNELLQAWSSRKWEAVIELSQALLGWLADGGFPPETQLPNEVGADWNREIAFAACQFARQRAQQAIEDSQGIPPAEPLSLVCSHCLSKGPTTCSQAREQGWTNIQYVPTAVGEYMLGICPDCTG